MNEIMSIFTPPTAAKLPYSKDFTPEDQTYLHRKYIPTFVSLLIVCHTCF